MWEVVGAALFPASNPYSWPVIGSMADLSAATVDDVASFFKKYYAPNNATLAVVGDIDIAKTKALIEKYFGVIQAGPAIVRPTIAPVTLPEEKRLVLEDARAQLPQLLFAWPSVGTKNADNTSLNALGEVLTQDRTSRLTKLLVYDRQLATRVVSGQNDYEDGGMFLVIITPRPEASLTEIERLVDSTLNGLATRPPTTEEVNRFKNYTRVQSVLGLDGALRKAEILMDGSVFHNDPLHYIKSTNATLAVTPQMVSQVAAKYLTKGRIVLSMVPAGKLDQAAKPDLPYKNVTPAPEVQNAKPASGQE
jgi:zinc protease